MNADCHFDDSLPRMLRVLVGEFGADDVAQGVILRDASGRLAFFAGATPNPSDIDRVSERVRSVLGPYARADRVVVPCDGPGAAQILRDPAARTVEGDEATYRYLDRRIVGADWLKVPNASAAGPPRVVFASLKGGVGRSTAISVIAAEQARRGRNILVVDLDLEAPGVGSLLLARDRQPALGVLDYLAEANLKRISAHDLDALVETSGLTSGAGLVDVVPVAGRRSEDSPENYLAKLSRAMLEGVSDAVQVSLADKIGNLLDGLVKRRTYDLVLIDSRAGLAELAAGPLLSLGANVLLFGTSQRQTLQGLRFLFAHLSTLVSGDQGSPWQLLKMVHAKAQRTSGHERFREELWELFSEFLYEELEGLEGFNFDVGSPDAPHNPIAVPIDLAFADWDPVSEPAKIVDAYYERTFGDLIRYVDDLLTQVNT